jgi:hypothetical protein
VPIISYAYTRPIASTFLNYKHVLRDLNIDDFKYKPPDCTCASSPIDIYYNPTGHVITGDLKIINNTSLRDVFTKGVPVKNEMKRETKHAKWNETKFTETKRNETKQNETQRNEIKWNEIYRNKTKQIETTRNQMKTGTERNMTKRKIPKSESNVCVVKFRNSWSYREY